MVDNKTLFVISISLLVFSLGVLFIDSLPATYNTTLKTLYIAVLLILLIVPTIMYMVNQL